MRPAVLARCLRALPVYGFGVLLVAGIARTFDDSRVIAATRPLAAEEQPAPPPALRLTVLVGGGPVPILLPVPVGR